MRGRNSALLHNSNNRGRHSIWNDHKVGKTHQTTDHSKKKSQLNPVFWGHTPNLFVIRNEENHSDVLTGVKLVERRYWREGRRKRKYKKLCFKQTTSIWAHSRLLVTKHHHCESASLLCGAAFLCMSEDVVNLLAGLHELPYHHCLIGGKLLSVCVCVCIREGFLLCTVCRLHRLWLNAEHRAGSALVSAKAGALEEAEGEGCGTGAGAKWFLWCFSASLLCWRWSTWMAGFSAIGAENHQTHKIAAALAEVNAKLVNLWTSHIFKADIWLVPLMGSHAVAQKFSVVCEGLYQMPEEGKYSDTSLEINKD